ncbi:hypothetical protein Xen7305DRAFT_00008580 [Xenococcus sp. PCC 7305]|uniref:hypothetical protein n=1 Tax=Xenococcus sp. PCC 7305 TaxID=102125 RepID=UPI0002ABA0FB|nr:hypothetical protein [Xenococcus sp. PCC 7305]ELS01156.1 hypothetical protein Xen7305DRAFT_00008580 [Xenococcus sp. PCC 7305]
MKTQQENVLALNYRLRSKLKMIQKSLALDEFEIEGFEDHYGVEIQEVLDINRQIFNVYLEEKVK